VDHTLQQYNHEVGKCRDLFEKKNTDYGSSWRILRPRSITDQIMIKALRIRSIEEKGVSRVGESIEEEFIGIYNYGIIGLIQLKHWDAQKELSTTEIMALYDRELETTRELMLKKNHDYGEAWREMRISSFTDLILMKINRTKQIEDNAGHTTVSEGIDANYQDMMNYAIFALITLTQTTPV
jgi:Nucleotide modification associated domain 1